MTRHDNLTGASPPNPQDDNAAVMTRSEEELRITTHRRPVRRARLTRHVETETVTRTVQLHREQVRVEYEHISVRGESAAPDTGSEDDSQGWMILYDEEIILTTRRVPRERVRLRTHTITEDRQITEELRRETIDIAGDRPTP